MSPARFKAYFLLILASLIWGIAGPVIKFTLGGIDPLPFLAYRFLLAGIFAVIVLLANRKQIFLIIKNFFPVFLYSIFATTISLGLLFLGMDNTTVLETELIAAVSPLIIALFGVYFLKEKVTTTEKTGIAIAFAGTVVTVLEPILRGELNLIKLVGNIMVFGYLVTNAYSAVLAKKLARHKINSFALSNASFLIGFFTIFPLAIAQTPTKVILDSVLSMPFQYHLGVLYMAFISGTFAYTLWIKAQKAIEVSEAGVFSYLVPIFASPIAVVWLGETATKPFIIGAIIITLGVIIAEYKRRTRTI